MIKVKSIQNVGDINTAIEVSSDKADNEFFDVLNYLDIPRRTENIEKEFDKELFFEAQQKDEI